MRATPAHGVETAPRALIRRPRVVRAVRTMLFLLALAMPPIGVAVSERLHADGAFAARAAR